jgi:hypothetical protein
VSYARPFPRSHLKHTSAKSFIPADDSQVQQDAQDMLTGVAHYYWSLLQQASNIHTSVLYLKSQLSKQLEGDQGATPSTEFMNRLNAWMDTLNRYFTNLRDQVAQRRPSCARLSRPSAAHLCRPALCGRPGR